MIILTNSDSNQYLKSLTTYDSLFSLQAVLAKNLVDYGRDHNLIPPRAVIETPKGVTHLFMPTIGDNIGIKALTGSREGFKGMTAILNPDNGIPLGVLNAESVTAFRTALASSLAFDKFAFSQDKGSTVTDIVCYGSGLQAYWHVRLALIWQFTKPSGGSPLGKVNVHLWNRTLPRIQELKAQLEADLSSESWFKKFVSVNVVEDPSIVTPKCQIIFGCTPSTDPIIKYAHINHDPSIRVFISLIGSYKPHMQEADSELIDSIDGKILVDSGDHVYHEAGEIIINKVSRDKLLEISYFWDGEDKQKVNVGNTKDNIVLWKCVGLSIMDICVSAEIIRVAQEHGFGQKIENF
ncbi:NAD(P)-binding protein [Nadsonia fulvescens var. elongata DSM 6958]|uniref:NAD(P)-binding protein n=1 Tax=Nadsonia fulvescens var. elongata DSM 6958 TaxID=857566 RepID=A0A1E3PU97_9ASCO|nr:NAD(P)-binding protein [Nadsonia fulvescens var. elongata DSM 6958]